MEHVDLYRDAEAGWRWRRVSDNGNIVSDSGEGYARKIDAAEMAEKLNPGVPIIELEEEPCS